MENGGERVEDTVSRVKRVRAKQHARELEQARCK